MDVTPEGAAAANEPDGGARPLQPTPCAEKKSNLWFVGVLSCMSSVLGLFGKSNLLNEYDENFYIKPERVVESKCIGEGAQGRVHLATLKNKDNTTQTVAIKYVQRIDDLTVSHLRKIKHENIVQTLGVCVNPPNFYILMEYCANGSLFDYMQQQTKFTPKQTISWAREIACGMKHLHDKNIVHRDLKSPNVLISDNLTAKVSDFGASRTFDGQSTVTSFVGTVNWMAPEAFVFQVIRAESYSEKVDIWSFAVVLWELVTLQMPYYKMEQHAIMWGVGTDSLSLPIPTGLPNSIHVLLVQCWNRRYNSRPTFAEIIQSLDLIAEELMLYDQHTFEEKQNVWAREARDSLEKAYLRTEEISRSRLSGYSPIDTYTRRDMKEKRRVLNLRLDATNDMFFEVCSVRLSLEAREREIEEKERMMRALDACRCGVRRPLKIHRQTSSSSDGQVLNQNNRAQSKKSPDANLYVNLVKQKTVTKAYPKPCKCDDNINHNKISSDNIASKKETVIEINGNINKPCVKPAFGYKAKKADGPITQV